MKKQVVMAKGERLLISFIVITIVLLVVGQSLSMAYLSRTNIELESVKKKIDTQGRINESLSMKINELASFDKVEDVAVIYGLEYNNNNIRVINNQ